MEPSAFRLYGSSNQTGAASGHTSGLLEGLDRAAPAVAGTFSAGTGNLQSSTALDCLLVDLVVDRPTCSDSMDKEEAAAFCERAMTLSI